MIVAIYAYEGQYQGLHGISHKLVVEVEDMQEAEEYAAEESRSVMESYGDIMEDFDQEAEDMGIEDGSDEYFEFIEECIQNNILYQIWEVRRPYDMDAMNHDFYYDEDSFFEKADCKLGE